MASQMRIGWRVGSCLARFGAATLMTTHFMPDDLQAGNAMTNIVISGTLTDKGVECPAMIGDDGQLYSLIGNIEDFKPGQHIRVEGNTGTPFPLNRSDISALPICNTQGYLDSHDKK